MEARSEGGLVRRNARFTARGYEAGKGGCVVQQWAVSSQRGYEVNRERALIEDGACEHDAQCAEREQQLRLVGVRRRAGAKPTAWGRGGGASEPRGRAAPLCLARRPRSAHVCLVCAHVLRAGRGCHLSLLMW